MMKYSIIFAVILNLFVSQVYAQDVFQRFSSDIGKYPAELSSYMNEGPADVAISPTQVFLQSWNAGILTDTLKSDIRIISNNLLDKNARPAPHFNTFLQIINLFLTEGLLDDNFMNWISSMHFVSISSDYNINQVDSYMSSIRRLLQNGILNQTKSTTWQSSIPVFQLKFDDSVMVYLENTDLTCYAVRDSLTIIGTSGIYLPLTQQWRGSGGKVTWTRSGYNPEMVYAEMSNFGVDMRFSEFRADSVRFTNRNFVEFEMIGSLEHKVERVLSPERTNFPRFESYQANYVVNDIYPSVDYSGGLNMQGARLIGSGTQLKKARLHFYRKDTAVIIAQSQYFSFEPRKITGVNTEISLYMEDDSIYHPSTGMNYFVDENRFSCYRTDNFQSQSPYYNSYHKVEMNFEQLSWNLNDNIILFKIKEGAASGIANFQSANLFDEQTYFRLQGIDLENPLVALRRFSEKEFNTGFYGQDFAKFTRARPEQMQQILKRLAVMGFITYDLEQDYVNMRQKTYDWIYASVNYIDYDVINLVSETAGLLENASLDLSTYDLSINGVNSIQLSNAQNVRIFPYNQKVTMKRNRDFVFDGVISAGLFTIYGKNFLFGYDDFKLRLQDIDSLSIRVATDAMDGYGQTSLLDVQSIIQDMTGELLIDDPENKSGRKRFPSYPILRSTENSFIYYDDVAIQNGVYERDNFYFEIHPFVFDSLDNFNRTSLNLQGRFHSANIFPDFEQTLCYLQDDNSLGFTYNTDEAGLPIYGGQGHYNNYLQMSNAGLRGRGEFSYLTSETRSDDIIFHPDSLFTTADEFRIQRQFTGIQYPETQSAENDLIWYPYDDLMLIQEGEEPFTILNDSTQLSGSLALSPSGLEGEGRMELTNSVLYSDEFSYTAYVFDADTADFRLKSVNTDGFTLITDNVNAHVDFEQRSGIFRTNMDFSLVEFPENRYVSRLDLFSWDMDNTELVMGSASATDTVPAIITRSDGELDLEGPRYISTDPMQDSLSFVSNRAVYDYRRNILRGSHVNFLRVADTYIYPGDGEVIIKPDGEMAELQQAIIIADRTTGLHEFYSSTVQVQGRLKYQGSGYFDYIDETGLSQTIHFNSISVDDSIHTYAEGMIPETQDFTLSPDFGYQGRVELYARNLFLTFDGGARVFYECECNEDRYVKFTAEIDPQNIYIPIETQPLDINMNYAYAGIFMALDSVHIYPSFMSRKKLPRDRYIVTSEGYLYFDKESGEYRIADMEKLQNRDIPGNYLSISRNECIEYGEGKVFTNVFPGQVMLYSVGNATHRMETDETEMNIALGMDFFMSEPAFEIMASEIDSLQELEGIDLADPSYMKVISEFIGADRAEALQAELGLYGEYTSELPAELNRTLFFTDIKFLWNHDTQSWYSEGKISLGSINGNQVNKRINGVIEFSKRRSGDLLDIYLELDSRTWYYFGYTRGVMHVLSSNREFNTTINDQSTRQRQLKTPRNQVPYIYIVATARKKAMFMERIEQMRIPAE